MSWVGIRWAGVKELLLFTLVQASQTRLIPLYKYLQGHSNFNEKELEVQVVSYASQREG